MLTDVGADPPRRLSCLLTDSALLQILDSRTDLITKRLSNNGSIHLDSPIRIGNDYGLCHLGHVHVIFRCFVLSASFRRPFLLVFVVVVVVVAIIIIRPRVPVMVESKKKVCPL
jgi:hypothetical protein